jgi:hypothetical protein
MVQWPTERGVHVCRHSTGAAVTRHDARAWRLLCLGLAWACGGDSVTGPAPYGYTEAELAYFAEIAFGAEYGGSANPLLHRWEVSPSIRVHGAPSAVDQAMLTQVMDEINALTQGVRLQRTDGAGEIDIYFVPQADFPQYEPNYIPGNSGFVWVWWDQPQRIVRARIMVASDISQEGRSHVIREELTQSLGLLGDSRRYPESIFYASPALIGSYAPIDRALIEMLYRPELAPAMTLEQALEVLRSLRRRGTLAAVSGQGATFTPALWVANSAGRLPRAGSAGGGSPVR